MFFLSFVIIATITGVHCSLPNSMQRSVPLPPSAGRRSYSFDYTSCDIIDQPNYDTNYNNESICVLSGPLYVSEFDQRGTAELICPYPNMYIVNVTRAVYQGMADPGPVTCGDPNQVAVPTCTVPPSAVSNLTNLLCRGRNRCAVPIQQVFWGSLYSLSLCGGSNKIYFIANYTCANSYPSRCFLYDTFCHPFDYSTMATGGLLKWNGPWVRSEDNSTALVTTNIYECQGLVNPDSECITMRSRPANQVSTLTNTFCGGNLTGVVYSYTSVSNQTNANYTVIITVDDVVVVRNNTLRSKAYTNESSVYKVSVRMPSTYYLSPGNHTVVISVVSNVTSTGAIFLRDFGIASSNSDANCNLTCSAAIYPTQSSSKSPVQSKSAKPQTKSSRPQSKSPKPQTKSSRPQSKSPKPQTKSSIPHSKSAKPQSKSNVPQTRSVKPQTKSAVPQTKSLIPQSKSNIPQTKSVVPQTKSQAKSKSPAKSKSHTQSNSGSDTNSNSASGSYSFSHSATNSDSISNTNSIKKSHTQSNSMSETNSASGSYSLSYSATNINSNRPQTKSQAKSKSPAKSKSHTQSHSVSDSGSHSRSNSFSNTNSIKKSESISNTNSQQPHTPPFVYTTTQSGVNVPQSQTTHIVYSNSQTNSPDTLIASVSPNPEYLYCTSFTRRRQRTRKK